MSGLASNGIAIWPQLPLRLLTSKSCSTISSELLPPLCLNRQPRGERINLKVRTRRVFKRGKRSTPCSLLKVGHIQQTVVDLWTRPLILASYLLFILLIGVPGWHYLTSIERTPLPSRQVLPLVVHLACHVSSTPDSDICRLSFMERMFDLRGAMLSTSFRWAIAS